MRKLSLPVTILILLLRSAALASSEEETIAFLRAGFNRTTAQLNSIRYTFRYERNDASSAKRSQHAANTDVPMTGTVTITRHGDLLNVYKSAVPENASMRVVVNERYTAVWWPYAASADQYDHASLAQDTAGVSQLIRASTAFDLLAYGVNFGTQIQSHVKPLEAPPGHSLHVSSDAGGEIKDLFQVTVEPDPAPGWRITYSIDSKQGFLITEVKAYSADGSLITSVHVEPKEIEPAIWVPFRATEIYAGKVRHEETKLVAQDIQLRPQLTPDSFSLRSMGLKERLHIVHTPIDGPAEHLLFINGQTVPREVVDALDMEQQHIDHLDKVRTAPQWKRSWLRTFGRGAAPFGIGIVVVGALLAVLVKRRTRPASEGGADHMK